MLDRGIYNFIKNALERGEEKERIAATLVKAGHPQALVDEHIAAAMRGDLPEVSAPLSPHAPKDLPPIIPYETVGPSQRIMVAILIVALLIGVAYYVQSVVGSRQSVVVNGKAYATWAAGQGVLGPSVSQADADAFSNDLPNGNSSPTDCSSYAPQPKVLSETNGMTTKLEGTIFIPSKSSCIGLVSSRDTTNVENGPLKDQIVSLPDSTVLAECDRTIAQVGDPGSVQDFVCSYKGKVWDMLRGDPKPPFFPLAPGEGFGRASLWDKLSSLTF